MPRVPLLLRLRAVTALGGVLCGSTLVAQVPASAAVPPSTRPPEERGPIEDNSFLIEEAYNQEAGVVQHISTFALERDRSWVFAFTQEWPVVSRRHQLSYTVPMVSAGEGTGAGLGDIAFHYRYQLADGTRRRVAIAPRLSLLAPSGDERRGRGAGGVGVQANLPVSVEHSKRIISHWNAGATLTPSARDGLGNQATTRGINLGASVIWLAGSAVNLMLEGAWATDEEVSGRNQTVRGRSFFLSPGLRGALDFPSGLQIVPGIALPVGIGPSSGDRQLLVYLSFEHAFKRPSKPSPES